MDMICEEEIDGTYFILRFLHDKFTIYMGEIKFYKYMMILDRNIKFVQKKNQFVVLASKVFISITLFILYYFV